MRRFLQLLFFGFSINIQAQTFQAKWEKMADLPKEIKESSGLIRTGEGTFWSHGDGGNASEIYEFDSTGKLLRTLGFYNANNIDWEDISQDKFGNIWLGDIGNNDSDREDLSIYKIENPNLHDSDLVHVSILEVSYEDQKVIPSPIGNRNFDVEGIACYKDSILLVTKNRSFPNSGYAKIYIVPAISGKAVAKLVDSIFTETHIQLGRITGADFLENNGLLYLTSLHQVFSVPFNGGKVNSDSIKRFRFDFHNNQFESIVMKNQAEFFSTAEKPSILCKGTLIESDFIYPLKVNQESNQLVYFNQGALLFKNRTYNGRLEVYDMTGKKVFSTLVKGQKSVPLNLNKNQIYVAVMNNSEGNFTLEFSY